MQKLLENVKVSVAKTIRKPETKKIRDCTRR